ncbi:unnamed protein product [Musa acuminata subsp. burmannicoides]
MFCLVQEDISKEFEEKKTDLQPKVVEIYEASAVEIKKPTRSIKKKSIFVIKFIEELVKIEFPAQAGERGRQARLDLASVPDLPLRKVSTLLPRGALPHRTAAESTKARYYTETAEEIKKEEAEARWKRHCPTDPPLTSLRRRSRASR